LGSQVPGARAPPHGPVVGASRAESDRLIVDLRQMILALETTLDLVGMNDPHHGKRVAYIASRLTHQLGGGEEACQQAFDLGLIHDCGVSTVAERTNVRSFFDWEDAHVHGEIGYALLRDFKPLQHLAVPVRHHHTPWVDLERLPGVSMQDKLRANVLFLSDRVEILAAGHYGHGVLLVRPEIVQRIEALRGRYFAPEVVDAFLGAEAREAFWITLEDRHIIRHAWEMGLTARPQPLSPAELKTLSLLIAYVVDRRSPFTARHSVRVAALARFLATEVGLRPERVDQVEVAALLHDIGKLRVPDEILNKAGPFTPMERAIMQQHSYETYAILRAVRGLESVARWAAYHHEGLDGSGYPFHPAAAEIELEARVVAVADVVQALVQDRPYRPGMDHEAVLAVTARMAADGKLDPSLVALVDFHAARCLRIARGEDEEYALAEIPFARLDEITHDLPDPAAPALKAGAR
jgi:putative nucleotidyltransferase with HDIG domain